MIKFYYKVKGKTQKHKTIRFSYHDVNAPSTFLLLEKEKQKLKLLNFHCNFSHVGLLRKISFLWFIKLNSLQMMIKLYL